MKPSRTNVPKPVSVALGPNTRTDLERHLKANSAFELTPIRAVFKLPAGGPSPVLVIDEVTTTSEALELCADARVRLVALLRHPSPLVSELLFDAGTSSLPLTAPMSDLLAAIRLAASGGCFRLDGDGSRAERSAPEPDLTPKEREVLDLLRSRHKPQQIALELRISITTVRSHLAAIRAKHGVNSTKALIDLTHESIPDSDR